MRSLCLLLIFADSIPEMVEKNPWWRNVSGPFPKWEGPIGCKSDGGGCHYARGKVGKMLVHTATHNRDVEGTKHSYSNCWMITHSSFPLMV